jgi:putative transposase
MARYRRLVVPGIALHIRQRGNEKRECFRSDFDRLTYLSMVRDLSAHLACELHAYCLMTNHVHLLITPPSEDACALMMHHVAGCYSGYFNRRYERTGVLWDGRFRSCLVDSASYVLACYRYIELNPVRARMVASPDAYPWSSYRANTGAVPDRSLSPHAEYAALSPNHEVRQAGYRALFDAEPDEAFLKAIRSATRGGYPMVGDDLKSALKSAGARVEPGKRGPRRRHQAASETASLDLDVGIITHPSPN